MTEFQRTCRVCFIERGQSILLKEGSGGYYCPLDARHKTPEDDVMVA